jgi:hypothetical protein
MVRGALLLQNGGLQRLDFKVILVRTGVDAREFILKSEGDSSELPTQF